MFLFGFARFSAIRSCAFFVWQRDAEDVVPYEDVFGFSVMCLCASDFSRQWEDIILPQRFSQCPLSCVVTAGEEAAALAISLGADPEGIEFAFLEDEADRNIAAAQCAKIGAARKSQLGTGRVAREGDALIQREARDDTSVRIANLGTNRKRKKSKEKRAHERIPAIEQYNLTNRKRIEKIHVLYPFFLTSTAFVSTNANVKFVDMPRVATHRSARYICLAANSIYFRYAQIRYDINPRSRSEHIKRSGHIERRRRISKIRSIGFISM